FQSLERRQWGGDCQLSGSKIRNGRDTPCTKFNRFAKAASSGVRWGRPCDRDSAGPSATTEVSSLSAPTLPAGVWFPHRGRRGEPWPAPDWRDTPDYPAPS